MNKQRIDGDVFLKSTVEHHFVGVVCILFPREIKNKREKDRSPL